MPIFTAPFVPTITTVAFATGATALPTGVETVISFGTINIDQNGMASLSSPSQLTIPSNGANFLWEFSFWITTDAVGGTGTYWMRAQIYRGGIGSTVIGANMNMYNIDAFQKKIFCGSEILRVGNLQAIQFTINQTSGATRTVVDGYATAKAIGINR